MNDSKRISVASTVLVGAVALAALAIAIVPAVSTPAANAENIDPDWSSTLQVAETAQSAEDVVPKNFSIDSQLSSSARYLGEYETASLWVGTGSDGTLCLLATFDGPMDIAASSCAEKEMFEKHGIGLQANTVDGAVVAYLLPDSVAGAESTQKLTSVHPNLLVGDPFAAGNVTEKISFAGDSSRSAENITLQGFGQPGDYNKGPAE